jgi:hypothetical protein
MGAVNPNLHVKTRCLAKQEIVPFYRPKGTDYNAWIMGAYIVYFLGMLPCQAYQWLALEDLTMHRSLEMCTLLEARQSTCQSKLHHVCVSC